MSRLVEMLVAVLLAAWVLAAGGCSSGSVSNTDDGGEEVDAAAGDDGGPVEDGGSDPGPADDGGGSGQDADPGPGDLGSGDGDGGGSQVPVLGGCRLFPPSNMWNTPIDDLDVHPLSADYIASIGADTYVHPDFGTTWQGAPNGIPYDIVPDDQPLVAVSFEYADESDRGPYPIPADAHIEGGPDGDGDRHVLILRQGSCILYELYNAWPQQDGSWQAGSGAIWHLDRNEQRPAGWTSADAAGLAILPGLVRWEEVYQQGQINHAIRVTLEQIQRAYIRPASHSDGRCGSDPGCPPMGLRLRLKASFDESVFPQPLQVIMRAMKRYGLVVADTGGDMYISGVPDERWDDDVLHQLHQLTADNFEAVYTGDPIPY